MSKGSVIMPLLMLSACGSRQNGDEASPVQASPQYDAAIRCWALADIVKTLVDNNVTDKASFKAFAQTAPDWRMRATAIGTKYGRSETQLLDDFQIDQIKLLAPVKEKPEAEAAVYIQSMVSGAGECVISSMDEK